VAAKLGVGTAETVRKWVHQAEIDAGGHPGLRLHGTYDASPTHDHALLEDVGEALVGVGAFERSMMMLLTRAPA
jgi:transposase